LRRLFYGEIRKTYEAACKKKSTGLYLKNGRFETQQKIRNRSCDDSPPGESFLFEKLKGFEDKSE